MAALRNFNGLASWRNAENSLQSVNLTRPLVAKLAQCFSGNQMTLDVEGVVDGGVGGEKPLR